MKYKYYQDKLIYRHKQGTKKWDALHTDGTGWFSSAWIVYNAEVVTRDMKRIPYKQVRKCLKGYKYA